MSSMEILCFVPFILNAPYAYLIASLLFGRMVVPLLTSPVGTDILLQSRFCWREEVPLELNSALLCEGEFDNVIDKYTLCLLINTQVMRDSARRGMEDRGVSTVRAGIAQDRV